MSGIVRVYQWLSAAFVTFMLISWIAVGTPVTTTRFLWFMQDAFATTAEGISDADYDLRPEIEQQRRDEEEKHYEYDGYWSEKKKKIGSSLSSEKYGG